jgi:chromosome segregation and condensation protein ScpB
VNVSLQLERSEITGLEKVAEGRAAAVPEQVVSRLLAMGLVQASQHGTEQGWTLQLTPKGLSFIRSSDQ